MENKQRMTQVYFVRHALPNYENKDDRNRELSRQGIEDCQRLLEFFEKIEVDEVFSSPFLRSIMTVEPIALQKGLKIQTIEDFREQFIEGKAIRMNYMEYTKKEWEDLDFSLGKSESLRVVQNRNITALEKLVNAYEGKTVVIGSHGIALSTVINYFRPDFGYESRMSISKKMPYPVRFDFEGDKCVKVEGIDLFTGERCVY